MYNQLHVSSLAAEESAAAVHSGVKSHLIFLRHSSLHSLETGNILLVLMLLVIALHCKMPDVGARHEDSLKYYGSVQWKGLTYRAAHWKEIWKEHVREKKGCSHIEIYNPSFELAADNQKFRSNRKVTSLNSVSY